MATPDSKRPLRPSLEKSTSSDLVDQDDDDDINQRKNVRSACTNCKRRKLKVSRVPFAVALAWDRDNRIDPKNCRAPIEVLRYNAMRKMRKRRPRVLD